MWVDEIVEETRKARDEYAAQFEYDIAAIVADVKEKEKHSERPVVSLPRKQPPSEPLAKADRQLDLMAADPEIRRELQNIEREFAYAEADGLEAA